MTRLVPSGNYLAGPWLAALACIATGAVLSFSPVSAGDSSQAAVESGFRQRQWPFFPPVRPELPDVEDATWSANSIDRFILARLEPAGIRPTPEADKTALLRRVTFDLTGLPPSADELREFLADDSPAAYLNVVDRLLGSPRFGERWAQHWLDLVRYADTEGFKADRLRENAFRYRDYVIDSFNGDRPFDEFIRQQLAGDELEPDNHEALIATGLLRLYPDEDNAANLFQRRQEILDDVTDTTGLVFLGLTMGCAQCHDHKFDEILQTDYYRLQAYFVSMAERDDLAATGPVAGAAHRVELARWEETTAKVRREIDEMLQQIREETDKFNLEKYEPVIVACYHKPPAERTPYEEQIARMVRQRLAWHFNEETAAKKLSEQDQAKYAELKKQLAEFESLKPAPLPMAMAVGDIGRVAPATHLLEGGNWKRPAEIVEPGFPEFLGAEPPEKVSLASIESTTGRRSQLAHWLTRRDHPLTARVIVNRLWQQHFGRGIVATPNDFGFQGERPTHPELLDWLAVELIENGWSLKHIHRLMVTSAAYQMSSLVNEADENVVRAREVDPDNRLLWRANRRRLEGEAIRDAMLQVSGELNLQMYGPSARPALPEGVSDRYAWEPDKGAAARNRRSVYVFVKRNMPYPLFEAFDQPDLHQSCARRAVTVTAPQSLAMLNSELTLDLAHRWAERLLAEHPVAPSELVRRAYRAAYSREPTAEETVLAELFLDEQSRLVAEESPRGNAPDESDEKADVLACGLSVGVVADFCHALFNSNEFIAVD
jgi:hypothetical protein